MSDKARRKGQADPMAFDVSKAALPALWQADPAFREIAKYLYGEDVTLETVQKDLFGKYDNPNKNISRALHHPGPDGGALCGAKNATKIAKVGQEANCPNCVFRAARSLSVVKMDPGPSDVHAQEPLKVGRKKKPMTIRPQDDEVQKNLEVIGKSFIDLVEKAYEAGLIDDDGNLDTIEIEKSRTYVRDHAGKFASQGKHTGKMVAGIAAAGALAGTGAALGARSPKALKYAGESLKFVTHHLRAKDPIERHVARSLLPHALKASGKAVGQAGLGATASAGAVYEGTKTYNDFRSRAVHKAEEVDKSAMTVASNLALRTGAEYVSRGTRLAERLAGYGPKHAAKVTRVKRLRGLTSDKVREAALDPVAPAHALREITKPMGDITKNDVSKDWKDFDAKRKAETAGGLAAAAGASEGTGRLIQRNRVRSANAEKESQHMWNDLARGSSEYAHSANSQTAASQASDFTREAVRHNRMAYHRLAQGERALKGGRKGAIGLGVGAGLVGLAALEEHDRKAVKKDAHEVVWEGDFSKVDEDKRQVFGWASVAELDGKPVIDLQGDYIHPDDVEKAAYDYVLKSRVGGDMHSRVDEYGRLIEKADRPLHVSDLIESMVFTPEKCEAMGISKNLAGRWWTGFQINDPDIWTEVKEGRRTGFSIHGAGLRKSIDIEELDPEAELIGKAYQESENMSQFIDNLVTLEDVTGHEGFGDLAKHLAHGINTPQINAQQGRNAGVYGSMGSGVGGLAGGAIGAKLGHVGEGAGIGATVGGLTGTAFGVHHGRDKRPPRPPSLEAALGVSKAVDNTNRMGGTVGVRQNMYQQQALQEATQMLAPQVAQHIQAMQEQRWQQQMMEQQMLAQQAQQQPQNFAVQMGPYANHQGGGQSGNSNPLAPSQQPQTPGSEPSMPQMPQTFSV